jgi:hypothetical protein
VDHEFTSFAELGIFLNDCMGRSEEAINYALVGAGNAVLETARSLPGNYQPEIGEFPAWEELSDETLSRRERRGINPEDDPLLERGDLRDSYKLQVTESFSVELGSDLPEAQAHEEGTEHVPQRAVIGPALILAQDKARSIAGDVWIEWMLNGRRLRISQTVDEQEEVTGG